MNEAEVRGPAQAGQAGGPKASGTLPPETKRALTALIIGGVAAVLDITIVSIALHTLVGALHSTVSQIQWVSTGYLLALGVPFLGVQVWLATPGHMAAPYQWQASSASSTSSRSLPISRPRRAMARPTRYFTELKCRLSWSAATL